MTVRAQFLFDFGSPNAWFVHRVMPALEARTGVKVEYVPILLGGVFKATGNASPAVTLAGIRNKGEYQQLETERFIRKHGINDYRRNPHFPVNTLTIMRGAIHARRAGIFERYVDEVFRHMWSEPKKMDEVDVIAAALTASGLPAREILEGTANPEVKAGLIANTEHAVERGVFGAPSLFVGDELFFGKDRLPDFEEEIERQKSAR